MKFPKHIDTISIGLPIVYYKGHRIISVTKGCLILANSADTDDM